MQNNKTKPAEIQAEYTAGTNFKSSIGQNGLFEQSKMNSRFYNGDQWYSVKSPNSRPLVRRNIIKRIGEYKLSSVAASPIAVNFSAEGVEECSIHPKQRADAFNKIVYGGYDFTGEPDNLELSLMMQFLTAYSKTTAERVKFDALAREALQNAYITGTGLIYTYFDPSVKTGLFVDSKKQVAIKGDIVSEVLDVENVVFGDPNLNDVQRQPYIIIAQRLNCMDVRREAKQNGVSEEEILKIVPESDSHYLSLDEPEESARVTVYTKFYKQYDLNGDYSIFATRTTNRVVIKEPFDIGIKLYPLAKVDWDTSRHSAYGESEVTHLIPNQIAINRALSAEVWSTMLNGMPIMLVNGDVVDTEITNDPGQIIKIYGENTDVAGAVRYVQPSSFAAQMINSVDNLATNTLYDAGANDVALGNVKPDNAAAIIQMREATLQPMQLKQQQYYTFIEDVMRIWAQFWLNLYSFRRLKISTENGTGYVPFNPQRYRELLINAKVDVGASTVWSTSVVVSSLDSLLQQGIITPLQYLERLPDNIIPNKAGLINEIRGISNESV